MKRMKKETMFKKANGLHKLCKVIGLNSIEAFVYNNVYKFQKMKNVSGKGNSLV